MGKRTDIKSILVLGAGPIVIGQACEFDYSGTQACKALKDEGYRVILVNSNPATIMTDPETADSIYIQPINWQTVASIIELEKPDAILPTMGGQTALNCSLDLVSHLKCCSKKRYLFFTPSRVPCTASLTMAVRSRSKGFFHGAHSLPRSFSVPDCPRLF